MLQPLLFFLQYGLIISELAERGFIFNSSPMVAALMQLNKCLNDFSNESRM
jgi:hypothetical protein